jgi:hypothetical protein
LYAGYDRKNAIGSDPRMAEAFGNVVEMTGGKRVNCDGLDLEAEYEKTLSKSQRKKIKNELLGLGFRESSEKASVFQGGGGHVIFCNTGLLASAAPPQLCYIFILRGVRARFQMVSMRQGALGDADANH